MIVLVDYGYGNIFSVMSALRALGYKALVTSDNKIIEKASLIIFPGVGAFKQAITEIKKKNLNISILNAVNKGCGIIGICLGYQMLFDESEENGTHEGLGLIKGKVLSLKKLNPNFKRVPNIGWRLLIPNNNNSSKIIQGNKSYVYFVHSFVPVVQNEKEVSSFIGFDGLKIHASVHSNNVIGYQFHPEKSGGSGLNLLKLSIEYLLNRNKT